MRRLHILPKFADRWSHIYIEHAKLDQDESSLSFRDANGVTRLPIDQLGLLLLGPGTSITHAAIRLLSENNCLICWTGEQGVRLYAHSTGGTHSSARLLRQAALYCDPEQRHAVVMRMYQKRFPQPLPPNLAIEQIRGMEGARVRYAYAQIAQQYGLTWHGRDYDQDNWGSADPLNRALSAANSCLYGICHAAILSAGYSPAIGFIHTGHMLSFVFDVADFYKTELTIPAAFATVAESELDIERRVRCRCRDIFHQSKLLERILPDIAEVLDARDDLGELPGELEGRIISLADRTEERNIPGESQRQSEGGIMADGTF